MNIKTSLGSYYWLKDWIKIPESPWAKPPHAPYEAGEYIPTWVAVAEERHVGNGDIWLADGYGSSLVHRFDKAGKHLGTLDGTEGKGRFNCPHGNSLVPRRIEGEFYIADRGDRRFQIYGMDGSYRRAVGVDFSEQPGCERLLEGLFGQDGVICVSNTSGPGKGKEFSSRNA